MEFAIKRTHFASLLFPNNTCSVSAISFLQISFHQRKKESWLPFGFGPLPLGSFDWPIWAAITAQKIGWYAVRHHLKIAYVISRIRSLACRRQSRHWPTRSATTLGLAMTTANAALDTWWPPLLQTTKTETLERSLLVAGDRLRNIWMRSGRVTGETALLKDKWRSGHLLTMAFRLMMGEWSWPLPVLYVVGDRKRY